MEGPYAPAPQHAGPPPDAGWYAGYREEVHDVPGAAPVVVVGDLPTRSPRPGISGRRVALWSVVSVVVAAVAVGGFTAEGLLKPWGSGAPPVTPGLLQAADTLVPAPVPAGASTPAIIVTPSTMDGDAPNPFVMASGGSYYMYSSQGNVYQPNVPLRTSTDLVDWSAATDAMPHLPAWAMCCFTWSPDVHFIAGRYVMWFTAVDKALSNPTGGSPRVECIGTATSASPTGPFVGNPAVSICQVDHHGSIDPHLLVDSGGSLWLYWKSDDNADVNGTEHSTIWVQKLAPDGVTFQGAPSALITADQPWEGRIVEDAQMVHVGTAYWLFYSAGWFNTPSYSIGVASCAGPVGPCAKEEHPWLNANAQGAGTGEASLFTDDDGQWWIAYAPFAVAASQYTPRPVALARIGFDLPTPYLAAP